MIQHLYAFMLAFSLLIAGVPSVAQIPAQVSTQVKSENTIIYAFMSNVGPLNPHLYTPNQMFAQEMLYEALVAVDSSGQIQPMLAKSWQVSDDGLRYTFQLRNDVQFSDGEAFNAQAAVKNFDAIVENKSRHTWLPVVAKIKSYQALDEFVFELVLHESYYPTLEDLSLPRPFRFLSPLAFDEHGFSSQGIRQAVGTGPWKLIETRLGEYDLFERNELYWGSKPQTQYILVKVIPDPISRALALNTGDVDLIYGIGQVPYNSFHTWSKSTTFTTLRSRPMGGMALAINTQHAPTNDLAVRQALQHAINKKPIIESVFFNSQTQADTLFSPDVAYCDIGLKAYDYDPAQASQLLEEAGWTLPAGKNIREKEGISLEIKYYYIGNDAAEKAIAEILQAQAAQVGIRLQIMGEEEDSFYRRQKDGSFGIISNQTWGPPFEPHAMLGSMREASHADYQAQLGLPMKAQIDQDITLVLQTQNPEKRQQLYTSILSTLHEQAVYLPIFYNSMLLSYKTKNLDNVHFGAGRTQIPFEDFSKKAK